MTLDAQVVQLCMGRRQPGQVVLASGGRVSRRDVLRVLAGQPVRPAVTEALAEVLGTSVARLGAVVTPAGGDLP